MQTSPKNKKKFFEYEDILIELHPKEVSLLLALRRKYRYGEVIILMRDGLPQRLKKVEIFDDLDEA